MRIVVNGKLSVMFRSKPPFDGHWCTLDTNEPVEVGMVLKATIVGTQTNPLEGGEQGASGARGREIVAWRGIDGVLVISEARCPHQFVHLASSGTVDGCELVCTAHFWRLTAQGEGSVRDTMGRREQVSALRVFSTVQILGKIWAYLPASFVVVAA